MASVIHRVTLEFRPSVNTPDFPSSDWIHNPDLSRVSSVERRYWIVDGDMVREMTVGEKDARVDLWKGQHVSALIRAVTEYGAKHYPLEQLSGLRDEWIRAKQEGRTAAVAYLDPVMQFDKLVTDEYRSRRDTVLSAATHHGVMSVSLDFSSLDTLAPQPRRSLSDARNMGVL